MTVIAGIIGPDCLYLGADSFVGSGWEKHEQRSPKVWQAGEYLLGSSGTARVAQIIRLGFQPPECGEDVLRHLVTDFTNALRECLRAHGALGRSDEMDSMPNEILIGVRGRLYAMGKTFGIGETIEPFAAIGSGHEYALGAFHASEKDSVDASDKLLLALEAAARFDPGVSAPFTIIEALLPSSNS